MGNLCHCLLSGAFFFLASHTQVEDNNRNTGAKNTKDTSEAPSFSSVLQGLYFEINFKCILQQNQEFSAHKTYGNKLLKKVSIFGSGCKVKHSATSLKLGFFDVNFHLADTGRQKV